MLKVALSVCLLLIAGAIPVVKVFPKSMTLNGPTARGTLQGHVRELTTGPITGAQWQWFVRNPAIVQPISSVRSAVTVVPLANGSGWITGTSMGASDSSFITITGMGVVPPSVVNGCPQSGYTRLVNVSTPATLTTALNAAIPGDQIRLAAGLYTYTNGAAIIINRSGTAANPIVVCGPRTAITRGGIWRVDHPTVYRTLKGFKIDGNVQAFTGVWDRGAGRNVYDSLEVTNTGQEGIMITGASSPLPVVIGTVVKNNWVHHVGNVSPLFGECIYLGDGNDHTKRQDSTWVHHNTVNNCPAEGIELKTGTHKSLVEFNTVTTTSYLVDPPTFTSAVEIRGNDNRINDNVVSGSGRFLFEVFADHVSGGLRNTFRRNTGSVSANLKMFNVNTNAGSPLTGNVFCNDNTAVAPTLLNVTTIVCP
jgi:hypothetical protein